jgi:hypothetical protein
MVSLLKGKIGFASSSTCWSDSGRGRRLSPLTSRKMAYNGTKLRPEHLKYQKYLWKDDLLPENPTKVIKH